MDIDRKQDIEKELRLYLGGLARPLVTKKELIEKFKNACKEFKGFKVVEESAELKPSGVLDRYVGFISIEVDPVLLSADGTQDPRQKIEKFISLFNRSKWHGVPVTVRRAEPKFDLRIKLEKEREKQIAIEMKNDEEKANDENQDNLNELRIRRKRGRKGLVFVSDKKPFGSKKEYSLSDLDDLDKEIKEDEKNGIEYIRKDFVPYYERFMPLSQLPQYCCIDGDDNSNNNSKVVKCNIDKPKKDITKFSTDEVQRFLKSAPGYQGNQAGNEEDDEEIDDNDDESDDESDDRGGIVVPPSKDIIDSMSLVNSLLGNQADNAIANNKKNATVISFMDEEEEKELRKAREKFLAIFGEEDDDDNDKNKSKSINKNKNSPAKKSNPKPAMNSKASNDKPLNDISNDGDGNQSKNKHNNSKNVVMNPKVQEIKAISASSNESNKAEEQSQSLPYSVSQKTNSKKKKKSKIMEKSSIWDDDIPSNALAPLAQFATQWKQSNQPEVSNIEPSITIPNDFNEDSDTDEEFDERDDSFKAINNNTDIDDFSASEKLIDSLFKKPQIEKNKKADKIVEF